MNIQATDSVGNQYSYEENFWTGKKKLFINGQEAQKMSKKTFSVQRADGQSEVVTVKGSFFSGVSVLTSGGEVTLVKNKWYEWILIFLPLVGIVFGVALCGAIGGFLSALFGFIAAFVNASMLRSSVNIAVKIFLCLVVTAVATAIWIGLWYLIASIVLAAVN